MPTEGTTAVPVTYQPWLVLLSIAMAIQGAYVGLSLSVQISDAAGVRRRPLLAGAAFSLAVAIWTMHFVGMLAVELPFPIDYLVFPTLLSFLVCVIVVGAARQAFDDIVRIARKEERNRIPFSTRGVDHAMHRRAIAVIRPSRDQIAEINHERARQWRHVYPRSIALLDLEPPVVVLP